MLLAALYAGSLWIGYSVTQSVAVDSVVVTISVTGQPTQRRVYPRCAKDSVVFVRPDGGTTVTATVTAIAYRRGLTASSLPRSKVYREPLADVVQGLPFGLTDLRNAGYRAPFTLSRDSYNALTIVADLANAKAAHTRVMLALTGGSHGQYLTNGVFDPAKWGAKLATFNTASIRQAVADGVSNGTIVGAEVMDEPNVSGLGDGNTWGPVGTMTKLRVDSLCGAVKQLFPTLATGVTHDYAVFEPTKSYRVCDFLETQWSAKDGDPIAYRDGAMAMGARDRMAILLGMNLINGGIPAARDGLWTCSLTTTGGRGTIDPNCRMTAAQVTSVGRTLSTGCGLLGWRFAADFPADLLASLQTVGDSLAKLPTKPCRRF